MVGDIEIPLLLRRHFLDTGRALIDVEMRELISHLNNEKVVFNVFKAMKHKSENPQCYRVDIIEDTIDSQGKSFFFTIRKVYCKLH